MPEAAIAIVHPHQVGAGHRIAAAAVFVHASAQVPGAGAEFDRRLGRPRIWRSRLGRSRVGHQQGGAAPLLGSLLQPEQQATIQLWLLDAGGAAHHLLGCEPHGLLGIGPRGLLGIGPIGLLGTEPVGLLGTEPAGLPILHPSSPGLQPYTFINMSR